MCLSVQYLSWTFTSVLGAEVRLFAFPSTPPIDLSDLILQATGPSLLLLGNFLDSYPTSPICFAGSFSHGKAEFQCPPGRITFLISDTTWHTGSDLAISAPAS